MLLIMFSCYFIFYLKHVFYVLYFLINVLTSILILRIFLKYTMQISVTIKQFQHKYSQKGANFEHKIHKIYYDFNHTPHVSTITH